MGGSAVDMDSRTDHLFLVLDNLLQENTEWADGPENTLSAESGLWQAIEETIELFGSGDIPGPLRGIEKTISSLRTHWEEYQQKLDENFDPNLLPTNAFWKILEMLGKQKEQATPKPKQVLESVKTLTEQKVSPAQIARIYGWVDARGAPETWKVQEEISNPGTHVNADYMPPREKQRLEEEARQEDVVRKLRDRIARKQALASQVAAETLEQLVGQGISLKQIATMKRLTVAEVMGEIKRLGLEMPPLDYSESRAAPARYDREPSEAQERIRKAQAGGLKRAVKEDVDESPEPDVAPKPRRGRPKAVREPSPETIEPAGIDEPDFASEPAATVEQEIVLYHQQNLSAPEIAEATGESVGKVRNTIQKFEKDPRAFSA